MFPHLFYHGQISLKLVTFEEKGTDFDLMELQVDGSKLIISGLNDKYSGSQVQFYR